MEYLLLAAVAGLSFANGANDNFKGVATLWGARRAGYWTALLFATGTTLAGSLAALWLARGLAVKFTGEKLVVASVLQQPEFFLAAGMGAAATVLLATWLGAPVSTTHALTGALLGAGMMAAGASGVNFAALGTGIALPLAVTPLVAVALTLAMHFPIERAVRGRDCLCLEKQPQILSLRPGTALAATVAVVPALRWAHAEECPAAENPFRASLSSALHWLSAAGISAARGLNDTPKIAALLLAGAAAGAEAGFGVVAVAMAAGGLAGAARVARTLSHRITPMAADQALSANLVGAALVTAASLMALPVSTTHVTSGGIFGIGLLRRREADWGLVRSILLAWLVTLPAGLLLAVISYLLLAG